MKSPYAECRIVLATMHGKERAIAPSFREWLGAHVLAASSINTDQLGTFTGDIKRVGTIGDVAIAKARLGMAEMGVAYGLASEGSYGPHPYIPFISGGVELLVLVDDHRKISVFESLIDDSPCFEHAIAPDFFEVPAFLSRIGFPAQAVIVSPAEPSGGPMYFKGLTRLEDVQKAVVAAIAHSPIRRALLETDMRAHFNPKRMAKIAELAKRLCNRLLHLCPVCSCPGFGRPGPSTPLPCSWCDEPTTLVAGQTFECVQCTHTEFRWRQDGMTRADPQYCLSCNP